MCTVSSSPEKPVVRTRGVAKSYRRGSTMTPVLNGIDLDIARGECVFLAGPSGSGKTTLLSILGCILSPDEGSVEILGEDVTAMPGDQRARLRRDRLGFVFQRFQLIRGLTSLRNVCVPLTLQGVPQRAAEKRAAALLEAVGLAQRAHYHPQNMSAGQCQRVAMARALVSDPELILADEPTASLDAASGQEAMKLLRRLTTEEGKTAVVVTHDPRIFPFADRILWLENGCVASHGDPSEHERREADGNAGPP